MFLISCAKLILLNPFLFILLETQLITHKDKIWYFFLDIPTIRKLHLLTL